MNFNRPGRPGRRSFTACLVSLAAFAASSLLSNASEIIYNYDAAGRLVAAEYGANTLISYGYDPAGNLLEVSQPAPALEVEVVAGNQLLLSWLAASGFVLEWSDQLGSSALWSSNGLPAPSPDGDFFSVQVAVSDGTGFYRLRKP